MSSQNKLDSSTKAPQLLCRTGRLILPTPGETNGLLQLESVCACLRVRACVCERAHICACVCVSPDFARTLALQTYTLEYAKGEIQTLLVSCQTHIFYFFV